jgi:hypothetical protein
VIEVGERVELHGLSAPLALDAPPKLAWETRRLTDVSCNDFGIHVRDPLIRGSSKKAFRVGCTQKAGSRHRIAGF